VWVRGPSAGARHAQQADGWFFLIFICDAHEFFCCELNQTCDVEKTYVMNRIKPVIHEW
jgi:hypothetical protein